MYCIGCDPPVARCEARPAIRSSGGTDFSCHQTDGYKGTLADVFGTQNSPPDPIKYTPPDRGGRMRTEALTDSQAEGRGFESPFPLHTQSLAAQGVDAAGFPSCCGLVGRSSPTRDFVTALRRSALGWRRPSAIGQPGLYPNRSLAGWSMWTCASETRSRPSPPSSSLPLSGCTRIRDEIIRGSAFIQAQC